MQVRNLKSNFIIMIAIIIVLEISILVHSALVVLSYKNLKFVKQDIYKVTSKDFKYSMIHPCKIEITKDSVRQRIYTINGYLYSNIGDDILVNVYTDGLTYFYIPIAEQESEICFMNTVN